MPIIWSIEPHTTAKHQILEEYLKAWFPIIASWANKIVYIDGFAGPGIYKNNEEGSPIIALRTATAHSMLKDTTDIKFVFIEKEKKRSEILRQTLKERFKDTPKNMNYSVIDSDFEKGIKNILNIFENDDQKLPPTFAFIDPFGYSDFSMDVVKRLLGYEKCEVLITFMTGFVNRFLDPIHEDAVTKLYGSNEFLKAKSMSSAKNRINFLLETYEKKLKENNGVRYVLSFEMVGKDNNVMYHLIFGTTHWRGLEVMKKAMLKVDGRGQYSFSDRLGSSQKFFGDINNTEEWMKTVAKLIFERFQGQCVSIEQIHEFVIVHTRYLFKKEILKILEQSNPPQILSVKPRKRILSYPAKSLIEFT